MASLTKRQYEILEYLVDYLKRHHIAPTLDEIAQKFGITKVTALDHLRQMEQRGVIRRERYRARAITILADLTREPPPVLPLCGVIRAGEPIEAVEDREEFDLGHFFPHDRECFALRVRGSSMIDDQIRDGDVVICESRANAKNGETVVAILEDGSATLKRFYREKRGFRLEPANSTMRPMHVRSLEIRGVVVGLVRRC